MPKKITTTIFLQVFLFGKEYYRAACTPLLFLKKLKVLQDQV